MATLRPRIGKHKVKHCHRVDGQEPFNRIRNLKAQNADIRQAGALHFSARGADAAWQALDPQKIPVRILSRQFGQKGAVTTAKVDFDQTFASVNSEKIERRETIRRDELDFTGYGAGRIGGQNVR